MIVRSAKYSEFVLEEGYERKDVVAELGEPLKSEIESYDYTGSPRLTKDTYIVSGRVFDPIHYWSTKAGWGMSLGLHEIVMFPASLWEVISEGLFPSKKYLEITYIYNKSPGFRVEKYEP